jgi:hypothetical protein
MKILIPQFVLVSNLFVICEENKRVSDLEFNFNETDKSDSHNGKYEKQRISIFREITIDGNACE